MSLKIDENVKLNSATWKVVNHEIRPALRRTAGVVFDLSNCPKVHKISLVWWISVYWSVTFNYIHPFWHLCEIWSLFFFLACVSVCFHLHPTENESRSHRFNTRYWSINCAHLGANMNQCYSVVTNKAQTGGKWITQAEKLNGKKNTMEKVVWSWSRSACFWVANLASWLVSVSTISSL